MSVAERAAKGARRAQPGIETAQVDLRRGDDGCLRNDLALVGLPNVYDVYERVGAALRRFMSAMPPTQAEAEPLPRGEELLIQLLGEVRAIRKALDRS